MKEIRMHGRGGQGAVLSAEILVAALVADGKYASAFPMFGFERRGAPVAAFVRVDDRPIREKTQIYSPDCVVIIDSSQLKSPRVFSGLKPEGIAVFNARQLPEPRPDENIRLIGWVDATRIALEEMGTPITNTCMLGAFAATTQWVNLDSILASLGQYFEGKLLSMNRQSVERGFREVAFTEYC
jgi:2-oxoacid:acceptor oxidoreductase gamma subunit (pyruvate/2-ketoisovalerate family)